jgi:hypothetical protein
MMVGQDSRVAFFDLFQALFKVGAVRSLTNFPTLREELEASAKQRVFSRQFDALRTQLR